MIESKEKECERRTKKGGGKKLVSLKLSYVRAINNYHVKQHSR